jgi:hypothetical protein
METIDQIATCRCGHTMIDHSSDGCIVYGCACARAPRESIGDERM